MKRLFKFKYPKLCLLIFFIILAYYIFSNNLIQAQIDSLNNYTYLGIFIAGLLFSFGFTTPFAIGFFVTSEPSNLALAALIGGIGAMLADLVIFKTIKFSFMDEFDKIKHTQIMKSFIKLLKKDVPSKIRSYLLYTFAGIVIASPLPDELGMMMLAGLSHVKPYKLAIISFIFNTIGILILLLLA